MAPDPHDHHLDPHPNWVRVSELGENAGVPATTARRWVRTLPDDQAEKRTRDAGGRGE